MSGPLSPEVASAAHLHALRAQAAASGCTIGRMIGLRLAKSGAEREGRAETPGGAIWRGFSLAERTLLVMHAAQDYEGDPRKVALQPWKSFSANDQAAMGAMARQLGRAFKSAVYLV